MCIRDSLKSAFSSPSPSCAQEAVTRNHPLGNQPFCNFLDHLLPLSTNAFPHLFCYLSARLEIFLGSVVDSPIVFLRTLLLSKRKYLLAFSLAQSSSRHKIKHIQLISFLHHTSLHEGDSGWKSSFSTSLLLLSYMEAVISVHQPLSLIHI